MDMYLEREAWRLEGIFKSQIQSTSLIPTQPLLAPPVPLVPLLVAEVPRAESPQFMESPMEPLLRGVVPGVQVVQVVAV